MMAARCLTAVFAALAACKDMHSEEDDHEYHGGPSSKVCRVRWSHDVTSFYCDGPALRVDELRPFAKARSVRLSDTAITGGAGARLESVTQVAVNRSKIDTKLLVSTFPRMRSLMLDSTIVDLGELRGLDQLSFLLLHKSAPPDAQSVAAIASLQTLMLNFVDCAQPGCDITLARQIKQLRPELEIKVDGDVVR